MAKKTINDLALGTITDTLTTEFEVDLDAAGRASRKVTLQQLYDAVVASNSHGTLRTNGFLTAGLPTLDNAAWVQLTGWDLDADDGTGVVADSTTDDDITLVRAGFYRVALQISLAMGGAGWVQARIRINGTVTQSGIFGTAEASSVGERFTIAMGGDDTYSASDVLTVELLAETGTPAVTLFAGQFNVRRLR